MRASDWLAGLAIVAATIITSFLIGALVMGPIVAGAVWALRLLKMM